MPPSVLVAVVVMMAAAAAFGPMLVMMVVMIVIAAVVMVVILVIVRGEGRKQRGPHRAHLAAAIKVTNRVLEDALEQHGEFFRRPVAVFFGQFQHAVLNDVEGGLFFVNSKHGLLEGATFRCEQKVREFALAGQSENPCCKTGGLLCNKQV